MSQLSQCRLCDLPYVFTTWRVYGSCLSVHDFEAVFGGLPDIICVLSAHAAINDYEIQMRRSGVEFLPWEYPPEVL